MKNVVRVASVQFQHRPGDKSYNMGRVAMFAKQAAGQGVALGPVHIPLRPGI